LFNKVRVAVYFASLLLAEIHVEKAAAIMETGGSSSPLHDAIDVQVHVR
jgi:hypothetical protein